MRELTIQSISDKNTAAERLALDSKTSQQELEINGVASSTSFGDNQVFDVNPHYLQIGPRSGNTLEVQAYTLTTSALGLNLDFYA